MRAPVQWAWCLCLNLQGVIIRVITAIIQKQLQMRGIRHSKSTERAHILTIAQDKFAGTHLQEDRIWLCTACAHCTNAEALLQPSFVFDFTLKLHHTVLCALRPGMHRYDHAWRAVQKQVKTADKSTRPFSRAAVRVNRSHALLCTFHKSIFESRRGRQDLRRGQAVKEGRVPARLFEKRARTGAHSEVHDNEASTYRP